MSEDIPFNKERFDAVLRRMIETKPMTYEQAKAKPKLRKDGKPKRSSSAVQKMDKP